MEPINIYVPTVVTPPVGYKSTEVAPSFPTLQPSLPLTVQLSLTIAYIVVFSFIFVLVYVQLWMIWYYRHKRLSYQTLFLFMCLIWAGLRTSLFSFYFKNCFEANTLDIALYWILYSLPVCLQFSMLCLLIHYFSQVVFKARAKYEPQQYKLPLHLFIGASVLVFMAINLACAVVTGHYNLDHDSVPQYLIYIRVTLTETMFFVYGILLSVAIYKMTKLASTPRVLEAQGTTVCKALGAAILITLLFLSRTIYNLVSICPAIKGTPHFGFDWINVTDQADAVSKLSSSLAYVSFGIVLFVWEVLPISIVVIFFRVKRLSFGQVVTEFSTQSSGSRVFFFDNQHRSDTESDQTSQPGTDCEDSLSPQAHIHNTNQSLTPARVPVMAFTPQQMNSSHRVSALPKYSGTRVTNYGPLGGKGLTPARTNTGTNTNYGAVGGKGFTPARTNANPEAVGGKGLTPARTNAGTNTNYGAVGGKGFTPARTNANPGAVGGKGLTPARTNAGTNTNYGAVGGKGLTPARTNANPGAVGGKI